MIEQHGILPRIKFSNTAQPAALMDFGGGTHKWEGTHYELLQKGARKIEYSLPSFHCSILPRGLESAAVSKAARGESGIK